MIGIENIGQISAIMITIIAIMIWLGWIEATVWFEYCCEMQATSFVYCVKIWFTSNNAKKIWMQQGRKKVLTKWPQNLELDVFISVESNFVVSFNVFLLLEADAPIFYPLNPVWLVGRKMEVRVFLLKIFDSARFATQNMVVETMYNHLVQNGLFLQNCLPVQIALAGNPLINCTD